jgi:hypothetical protein
VNADGGTGHVGDRPTLRIVRGDPTPEELAAVVAVLAAASAGDESMAPAGPGAQWAPPARLMRQAVAPTGWWESSLPR